MNPLALALASWVLLGVELGARDIVSIRLPLPGPGIAPSFLVPLAVFVCMGASAQSARWACLCIGLGLDLTSVLPTSTDPPGTAVLVGPHALGLLLAAQLVLSVRRWLVARNPLTIGVLSAAAMLCVQVVLLMFLTSHRLMGDPIEVRPIAEAWQRMLASAATGAIGLVLAYLLYPMSGTLGLDLDDRSQRWARTRS